MTGACVGQYSDGGVMHCLITVPWWACAIVFGVLLGLAWVVKDWQ